MQKGQDESNSLGKNQSKSRTSPLDFSLENSNSSYPPLRSFTRNRVPVSHSRVPSGTDESSKNDNTSGAQSKKNRRQKRKDKHKSVCSSRPCPKSPRPQKTEPISSLSEEQPSTSTQRLNAISQTSCSYSLGAVPKVQEVVIKSKSGRNKANQSIVSNETKFTCDIRAVKKPHTGKAFRKRSKKHKYINLKSFLGLSGTCVFESHLYSLSTTFKNLALESKPKRKHKYYDKVEGTTDNADFQRTIVIRKEELIESLDNVQMSEVHVQVNLEKSSSIKKDRRKHQRLIKKTTKESQESFPPTITPDIAKTGEESGEFLRGFIRVNPKNSRESYVSNSDSTEADYCINSVADRNTALDGDEVLLKVKPELFGGKKAAFVVFILNKIHPRTTVGSLKLSDLPDRALFQPRDKRMPNMLIPETSWPNGFKNNPKDFKDILVVAKLVNWLEPNRAVGAIIETLGKADDLHVETMAILKEFALDITPISPDMIQHLPKTMDISPKELKYREDIRKECVFTIDPLTARDLDDAVSAKELPNGHYEVGVHISDASYYVPEGTSLDKFVSSKATTIYLVDSVYHMLPVELCLHCSLLPGEDKLAFSVFWEIDEKGEIYNTRFVRTVLNSCAQLAYEHAQQMIENPDKEFKKEELPTIMNGFRPNDLSKTVTILKKIAANLREARVRNGSLRLDQVKLLFSLHPRTGEPVDFIAYENKEAHRLIEEFMLLANISVARKINETFPDIAFLRCHEPPKYRMLREAQTVLETCGIHIDISSSGGINSSLNKYITDDYLGYCRGMVLNHLFSKPMARARYFCAGTMPSDDGHYHYALSVPIYTHFTSPIRRYADIMVHRLLAASLGYIDKPKWDLKDVSSVANNCNQQKYNAKRAGEVSGELYLAHYIASNQPYIQDCVVTDIKERSFDAIVLKTGSTIRIYQNTCEDNPFWALEDIPVSDPGKKLPHSKKVFKLIITFPKTEVSPVPYRLIVEMFSIVKVKLRRVRNTYKLEAFLIRPVRSQLYTRSVSAGAASTSSDI